MESTHAIVNKEVLDVIRKIRVHFIRKGESSSFASVTRDLIKKGIKKYRDGEEIPVVKSDCYKGVTKNFSFDDDTWREINNIIADHIEKGVERCRSSILRGLLMLGYEGSEESKIVADSKSF